MPAKRDPKSQWITDNWDDLSKKYPFEWIAVSKNGVVAHSQNLKDVIKAVDEADLDDEITFSFIIKAAS